MHEPGSKSATTTTTTTRQQQQQQQQSTSKSPYHGSNSSLGPPSTVPPNSQMQFYLQQQQQHMASYPRNSHSRANHRMMAGGAILGPSAAAGGLPGPSEQELAMTLLPPNHPLPHAHAHPGHGPAHPMGSHPMGLQAQVQQQQQVQCKKNLQKMMGISPSDIDKYSRIFFPVTFTCFNLMYWIIYLHVSDEVAEDLVMLNG